MAKNKIVFKQSVAKDLRPIPGMDIQRIVERINQLAENFRPPSVEKLPGEEKYCLRQ